ncbi:MAG: hypothetical protein IKW92_09765 [Firmicutes bacterium]|nr:hypothetical protein [Bacillota bacterium]
MKGFDLLKGVGYIDDDLVEEALGQPAANQEKGKLLTFPARWRWVAAAACLAIAFFAGWGVSQSGMAHAPMADQAKNASDSEIYYTGAMEEGELEDSMVVAEAEPAEAEPAEVPEPDAGEPRENEPAAAPAEAPMAMESDEELAAVSEMIESYPGDYSAYCYAVPAAGQTGYSVALQDAMAVYDNAVTYRVYVEIFKEGSETPLKGDDKEVAELLAMLSKKYGITTALEKVKDTNGKKQVYPTLHATFEQLRRFPADEHHGWMLYLYDERPQ